MIRKILPQSIPRKLLLAAAASALALGVSAPAAAGGYVKAGYHSGYYGGGYYAAGHRYYGHRHYRHGYRHHGHHRYHRRHHHHGGGGKAAAIALGVIGGAIILNEIAEDRERDRYARGRYYEGYYDGRRDARADAYYERRAYDDRYYEDDRAYDDYDDDYESDGRDDAYDDELDGRLEGGADEPIYVSVDAAYDACLRHARSALAERGFIVSAPYRPETAEDRGGAWLMTATVTAQRGPDRWSRAMSCEASDTRVYRMELI